MSKPSQRKPKRRFKIPEGLVQVWAVRSFHGKQVVTYGYYVDEDRAYAHADEVHEHDRNVYVENKGGYAVDGKMYLVNVLPIKVTVETQEEPKDGERGVENGLEEQREQLHTAK
jgi:hypothetical protein